MNAVEVKQDTTGVYEIVGEPEPWEDVQENTMDVMHSSPLIGWTPYTRVYSVKDFLGDRRIYFVAE